MPYILPEERERFDNAIDQMPIMGNKGELEYVLFSLMVRYMGDRPVKYSTLSDCTYAAMHCADEFRRRFLDQRENEARIANGDIAGAEENCYARP
jgi:hypothetical protein